MKSLDKTVFPYSVTIPWKSKEYAWVLDNINRDNWCWTIESSDTLTYHFKNSEDAAWFRLKWG